jgi:hypothetical protein
VERRCPLKKLHRRAQGYAKHSTDLNVRLGIVVPVFGIFRHFPNSEIANVIENKRQKFFENNLLIRWLSAVDFGTDSPDMPNSASTRLLSSSLVRCGFNFIA